MVLGLEEGRATSFEGSAITGGSQRIPERQQTFRRRKRQGFQFVSGNRNAAANATKRAIYNFGVQKGCQNAGWYLRRAVDWPDHIKVVLDDHSAVLGKKPFREFGRNQPPVLFLRSSTTVL
jgi:hypothetical protein